MGKNNAAKWVAAILIVTFLATVVFFGHSFYSTYKDEQERLMDESIAVASAMEANERELAEKYINQNEAIMFIHRADYYLPYELSETRENRLITSLACYKKHTGITLTVEEIQEYLAEELEKDGTERVYTSEEWVHIQKYIEWHQNNEDLLTSFSYGLIGLQVNYAKMYPQLEDDLYYRQSRHNFLELLESYLNPDYEPQFIFDGEIAEPVFPTSEV